MCGIDSVYLTLVAVNMCRWQYLLSEYTLYVYTCTVYLYVLTFSFYFVGDEDLLEIIGNSKNVPRLQKHFKKMFAGVHSVILSEDLSKVLGISAKEGEKVGHLRMTPANYLPF